MIYRKRDPSDQRLAAAHRNYVAWLVATRNLSSHTIRAYRCDLVAFERFAGPSIRVATIDRPLLLSFLESLQQQGLAPATIKRRACSVRGFCNWLSRVGALDDDVSGGLMFSVGRGRRLPRAVPDDQLDCLLGALLDVAGGRDPAAVARDATRAHDVATLLAVSLMVATGVRVNELVNIRCRDIDLSRRSIRILGKGRRERQVYLTNDWLAELVLTHMQLRTLVGVRHDHLLFNTRLDPLSPSSMRARLARAANDAGLGGTVTPHMLRHSAATRLVEKGVDIRMIQALLGHASLATTEIYTHVSNMALRRAISDVDVLGTSLARGDN